jgi:Tyrosine phosphatase family
MALRRQVVTPRSSTPCSASKPLTERAALDEMQARFGTIEAYFSDGLDIDTDGRLALRAMLVE